MGRNTHSVVRESRQNAELCLLWAGMLSDPFVTSNEGTVSDASEMKALVPDPFTGQSWQRQVAAFSWTCTTCASSIRLGVFFFIYFLP